MAKSYNPFGMWGSYFIAIICVLIVFLYPPVLRFNLASLSISLIFGFLIGWGIHSLFRSLRNKNGKKR